MRISNSQNDLSPWNSKRVPHTLADDKAIVTIMPFSGSASDLECNESSPTEVGLLIVAGREA